MLLKIEKTDKSYLSIFDILGSDENALSKAFAYLLACKKDIYFDFIKFLGLGYTKSSKHYRNVRIEVQRKREEGITDIELFYENEYHVIIECKIAKGKITRQRRQYIPSFQKYVKKKLLCFLTQERDNNLLDEKDVRVRYVSWLEITHLLDKKIYRDDKEDQRILDFLKFAQRNYNMKAIKEILVQDIKDAEKARFQKYNLYRRDVTIGNPLYFAPYFTKSEGAENGDGIFYLSKILGILTIAASEIDNYKDELKNFTANQTLIEKWLVGIRHDIKTTGKMTYYFLEEPLHLNSPLKKSSKRKESKGWIANYIPKNRCVSFEEFIKHIPELMTGRI